MQYEPKSLPFWEIERGDGPLTRIENCRKNYKRTRKESCRGGSEPARALAEGCSWPSREGHMEIRRRIY